MWYQNLCISLFLGCSHFFYKYRRAIKGTVVRVLVYPLSPNVSVKKRQIVLSCFHYIHFIISPYYIVYASSVAKSWGRGMATAFIPSAVSFNSSVAQSLHTHFLHQFRRIRWGGCHHKQLMKVGSSQEPPMKVLEVFISAGNSWEALRINWRWICPPLQNRHSHSPDGFATLKPSGVFRVLDSDPDRCESIRLLKINKLSPSKSFSANY